MEQMDVDDPKERDSAEKAESSDQVAVVRVSGSIMNSFLDSSMPRTMNASTLIKMAHHMRLLQGRYFFLKSSKLTTELLNSKDSDEILANVDLKTAVSTYHTYVNAHLIKQSLRMHPFLSTFSAGLIEAAGKRKNTKTFKTIESLFKTSETLSESVTKETELYNDYLEHSLSHPAYFNRSLLEIDDHRASLRLQNVDKEAKERVAKKKAEVKFLAEISSRLLAITPIEDSSPLSAVLIDLADVLDQVL